MPAESGPERVEARAAAGCAVDYTLDFFHVMKKIARAFPDEGSAKREWAVNLAVRGKGGQLARLACYHRRVSESRLSSLPSTDSRRGAR